MHCRKIKWGKVLGSAGEHWGADSVAILSRADGNTESWSAWQLRQIILLSSFHRWHWVLEYKNFFSRIDLPALLLPESISPRSICYNFLPSCRMQSNCTQLRNYISSGYARSVRKRRCSVSCGSYNHDGLADLLTLSPSWDRTDLSAWCSAGFYGHRTKTSKTKKSQPILKNRLYYLEQF